jgi:hypothetical protein
VTGDDWVEGLPDDQVASDYRGGREIDLCAAIAHLLLRERVIVAPLKPDPVAGCSALLVNASDVFMWACTEWEPLPYDEIASLYEFDHADPNFGTMAWCIAKRQTMPQAPVARDMRAWGWDLEALIAGAGVAAFTPRKWTEEELAAASAKAEELAAFLGEAAT